MTEERDAAKTKKVEGGMVRVRDLFMDGPSVVMTEKWVHS